MPFSTNLTKKFYVRIKFIVFTTKIKLCACAWWFIVQHILDNNFNSNWKRNDSKFILKVPTHSTYLWLSFCSKIRSKLISTRLLGLHSCLEQQIIWVYFAKRKGTKILRLKPHSPPDELVQAFNVPRILGGKARRVEVPPQTVLELVLPGERNRMWKKLVIAICCRQ